MTRTEQKYLDDNGMNGVPLCYCGHPLKFRSYKAGYSKYCSIVCANSDPKKKELTRQNILLKYGVENISQLDSVKAKKVGKCNKGRGRVWTDEKRARFQQTMLERYGVMHPSQMDGYLTKRESTWLNKYGVKHVSELSRTKISKRNKRDELILQSHDDVIRVEHLDGQTNYVCVCQKCGEFLIPSGIYYDRKRLGSMLCTRCQPVGYINNSKLESFVESILTKAGIKFKRKVRGIIGRREFDFYIPDHNIAIECNGVYWHSDKIKSDKQYHIKKFKDCQSHHIQLIQLWEDWIINKPDIVEDLILSKLGIFTRRIPARKCIVRPITQTQTDSILQYHIQGTIKASIRLGLFYNGELVSCMLFNKFRGSMMGKSNEGMELARFCTMPRLQVVGGAGKLLNYFIKEYQPDKIISFSANDISSGKLYINLGFVNKKQTSGSYWYIQNNTLLRFHRYHFRKSELRKMGYGEGTEFEIMNELPYLRIYDSGTTCWELEIKKEEQ